MIKKERKSPSQKKVAAAAVPDRRLKLNDWQYKSPLSCPNLSHEISRSQTIRQNISGSGGITKSWISSCCVHQRPRQTWPQLVETNISPENRKLRSWDSDIPFQFSASSNDGTYANVIVITGISSPAFAFYRRDTKDYKYGLSWRMRDCRIKEPYSGDDRHMEFTNVIGLQGKFYAISRQGSLALIEDEGNSGNFEITALGRNRVVPYCKESRHFREYLLKYKGEIYLVFLLSRASINVVDDVEVLLLDKSRLIWKKMDRLIGDAMFFVEDYCCVGISASLLGCSKGSNCVYFTHDRADDTWFVYDMKTSCISTTSGPEIDLPIPRIS
ncbi:hypothetical protein PHJA_000102400 [Phtheirospermum japonicum]|uniref:KIB1-4 beta-propeller domain-containing protein n=1 Tax=Phtheirospermum japonicum TaxID=374723 RepID=A0A830B2K2_9LAMI|nr:hypothetical protein PHJA_000102400 [Phtheirospermum japonicum]